MSRALPVVLLVFLITSCGEKLPDGVISPKQMEALLVDVHLLDAQLSHTPIDSSRMIISSRYEQLLEYHRTDSQAFQQSLTYYASRPTQLRGIYTRVDTIISGFLKIEQDRMAAEYRERMFQDSIAAAHHTDSLRRIAAFTALWTKKRHLLFRHEADSTVDPTVPVRFDLYSKDIFESLGLWPLHFGDSTSIIDSLSTDDIPEQHF